MIKLRTFNLLNCAISLRMGLFVAIYSSLSMLPHVRGAQWEPPANANSNVIFHESTLDIRAGRYGEAFEKLIWISKRERQDALSSNSLRTAFHESTWQDLIASGHTGAVDLLREFQVDRLKEITSRESLAIPKITWEVRQIFYEFSEICVILNEKCKIIAAFRELDTKSPVIAEGVYYLAQPYLVEEKEYVLCGKYLKPKEDFQEFLRLYKIKKELLEGERDKNYRAMLESLNEDSFLREAATIVALAQINGRKTEAEEIANQIDSISRHADRKRVLQDARRGIPPAPGDR